MYLTIFTCPGSPDALSFCGDFCKVLVSANDEVPFDPEPEAA